MDGFMLLKGACLASGFAMHISAIPTMREIMAAGNTLNFHIAPYASGFLNQSVNMWYAYIRGDVPLMVHRMCGIAANTYYLSTYLAYSSPPKMLDNRRWLLWVGGLLLSLFIYLHLALPFLGFAHLYNSNIAVFGAITGVGLAAAPLATVREVLRTKDASSIPSTLVLMQFIQFFSWTVYGWVVVDWSTFANNLVGVILGSFQLFLIGYFGNKRSSNSTVVAGSNSGSEEVVSNVIEAAVVEEEAIDNLPSTNLLKGKAPSMQSESKHR